MLLLDEGVRGITDQSDGVEDVSDDHGSEDIQFEVTIRSTDSNSDVVTHNLAADHRNGFTLGWVDLTEHDRTAWFVFREEQFSETTSGARSQESDIVSDLYGLRN